MPNYCDNTLFLSHQEPEMIARAIEAFNNCQMMSEFAPCPKELTETVSGYCGAGTYEQELLDFKQKLNIKFFGYKDWYDWNNSNWGTKWDIGKSSSGGGGYAKRISDTSALFSFISAWCPPIQFYEKMTELGFVVDAKYHESGMGFCGSWHDYVDDYYDISGNSNWVMDNIPSEIDEEFCISSNMAEWEADQLQEKIDELNEKIEGEGCEETCKKHLEEIALLKKDLNRLEEIINV